MDKPSFCNVLVGSGACPDLTEYVIRRISGMLSLVHDTIRGGSPVVK
jgi:hypothetical protein